MRGLLMLALALSGCADDVPVVVATMPPCDPLEITLSDGTCVRPGIDPMGCASGFEHDGEYGCEPILPEEPCPSGWLAVPGETACRPVMPCSEGKWGAIPIDATTAYVDASYAGGASDGSAERPWLTIQDAIAAAVDGAVIAVAAGTYPEQVRIDGRPVRLWGVCPDKVELAGPLAATALVIERDGASGTEIHGIAISSGGFGVVISGARDVSLDRVWVHDTSYRGIIADATLGPPSLRVVGSLLEKSHEVGVLASGSEVVIESSVVRGVLPRTSDQTAGRGIYAGLVCTGPTACDPRSRSALTVRGSVVEQNTEVGVSVLSSDAIIEASVVRDTLPRPADSAFGRGVGIQYACYAESECDASLRASATLRGAVVRDNYETGIIVLGSTAVIETSVVRGTKPRAVDDMLGRAVSFQNCAPEDDCASPSPAEGTLRSSLITENHEIGVVITGSQALLDRTVVRDTLPEVSSGIWGRGIHIQGVVATGARGTAHVLHSLVARNRDVGVFVFGSDATMEGSEVREIRARDDGRYGDGLTVYGDNIKSNVTVMGSSIVDSERAGIANFGSFMALVDTSIRCAGFELEGEVVMNNGTHPFLFEDRGGNRCGCPVANVECVSVSAGLEPPGPAAPP